VSLTRKAASGAFWSIGIGLAARVFGLVGTIVITHHLAPDVLGEVAAASLLAFSASAFSAWGFNQYVVVKADQHHDGLFHATVLHVLLGLVALTLVVLLAEPFARLVNAPNLGQYLPGMALVVALKRLASIPDKLLLRDMRFKYIAVSTGAGELIYVALAVGLVIGTSLGGHAIIVANIVQALVVLGLEVAATGLRWLAPKPWSWERVREILRFGAPIGIESALHEAGRSWDKLYFSHLFGPHDTGMYSLAYNLSDLPATYVGEHVASVLFPTMVQIEPERRNQVFAEACGLLAMVAMPMGVGLASVSDTLVKLVLSPAWQGVAGFLVALSAIAIFRPLNAALGSLLIATERNWLLLSLEVLRIAVLFTGMWYLARHGENWAAAAVGLAMGMQFAFTLVVLARQGFPVAKLLAELRGPALAAALIALTVPALDANFEVIAKVPLAVQLAIEVAVGGLVYVAGLALFARTTLRRFIEIVSRQLRRRKARAAA
jgi:O-antigen/teichoic acid export membrane protein